MTFQVLKSQLRGVTDFPAQVTAHVTELTAHAAHMALVALGQADPYPPPFAPALVDQAIRRDDGPGGSVNYVEDYEIVDDGPTADQLFAARKHELLSQVAQLEQEAMFAILPRGKQRLAGLQLDAANAKGEKDRTDADKAIIAEAEARAVKFKAIELHAATQMAAIEDLTPDTIEAWKPTAFL